MMIGRGMEERFLLSNGVGQLVSIQIWKGALHSFIGCSLFKSEISTSYDKLAKRGARGRLRVQRGLSEWVCC